MRFSKPVHAMSPDEAGALVDAVGRKWITATADELDDLLLVASGHAALLRDPRALAEVKEQVCSTCGKTFQVLRKSARYCSQSCRKAASRQRSRPVSCHANSLPPTPGIGSAK